MDHLNEIFEFAQEAHAGQKYGTRDYFMYHLLGVTELAVEAIPSEDVPADERFVANVGNVATVAILHDIIEDTDTTYDDLIMAGVNDECICAIMLLTKQPEVITKLQIEQYLKNIRANPLALHVKIADMSFNIANNIKERNLKRFTRYSEQMKILLAPKERTLH